MSIKGHNSVLICRNLSICNTKTLLCNINSYTQFVKKMHKIESENKFERQSRAITLYLSVKIYPSAIPEHSTISTLIPSLKKIGKGMPKIENENQFLTSIIGGGKLFPAGCSIYLFRILALYISTSLRSAVCRNSVGESFC